MAGGDYTTTQHKWPRIIISCAALLSVCVLLCGWIYLYYQHHTLLSLVVDSQLYDPRTIANNIWIDEVVLWMVGFASAAIVLLLIHIANSLMQHERVINQIKEKMTHVLVHDLRNPLVLIQGYAEVIQKDKASPHFQSAEIIRHTAKRLVGLISELLDIQKLKQENRAELEIVNLTQIITDIVKDNQLQAQEKEIVLDADTPTQQSLVRANREMLERVITNILSNALQHTPEQGHIIIASHEDPASGHTSVSIQDNGPGIPKDEQAHIFKPFYQGSNTHQGPSSGLGLTSAKMMTEQMNGTIDFTSSPRGTRFTITIPQS